MEKKEKQFEGNNDLNKNHAIILMISGLILVLMDVQIQIFTETDLQYSALGGFLFLAGLLFYMRITKQL